LPFGGGGGGGGAGSAAGNLSDLLRNEFDPLVTSVAAQQTDGTAATPSRQQSLSPTTSMPVAANGAPQAAGAQQAHVGGLTPGVRQAMGTTQTAFAQVPVTM
jgi:hypothetical protein